MALELALKTVPSTASLYLKALVPGKRVEPPRESALLACATLKNQPIDPARLVEYCRVCGFSGPAEGRVPRVPATYPFVMAMPLQLSLLVSEAFPYSVLGIVHVRNEITQYRPIEIEDRLDFRCELYGPRHARRGLEFDLVTRVYVQESLIWECVSTMLRRDIGAARSQEKAGGEKRKRSPARAQSALSGASVLQRAARSSAGNHGIEREWQIGANTGRRYARVSGDRNPIHLYTLSAKLFGFPGAIAHGMWTKARCLAELEPQLAPFSGRFKIAVAFRKPIMLPASVVFTGSRELDAPALSFSVKAKKGRSPHLHGSVEAITD
ncbi:MaoC/PaaZ C-terminal domain-containing protein [Microbulbifer sp.]|uniref:MaoC/PaaZ C-terminal domain-containing protein n=1 Tax=Microbulbifer sp. TaxID=1908541 RepID=UPI0025891803|nr:MaoC/PaaZ C-terminal domain-containing protein [Microbulbifer sp.]